MLRREAKLTRGERCSAASPQGGPRPAVCPSALEVPPRAVVVPVDQTPGARHGGPTRAGTGGQLAPDRAWPSHQRLRVLGGWRARPGVGAVRRRRGHGTRALMRGPAPAAVPPGIRGAAPHHGNPSTHCSKAGWAGACFHRVPSCDDHLGISYASSSLWPNTMERATTAAQRGPSPRAGMVHQGGCRGVGGGQPPTPLHPVAPRAGTGSPAPRSRRACRHGRSCRGAPALPGGRRSGPAPAPPRCRPRRARRCCR